MGKGQQKKREAAAQAAMEEEGSAPRGLSLGDFMPSSASLPQSNSHLPVAHSEAPAVPAGEEVRVQTPAGGSTSRGSDLGGTAEGFRVQATKRGGVPIEIEKRNKGKHVTVVKNVTGDLTALLKLLKTACGGGGVIHPDTGEVEVQGEHVERVEQVLRKAGCLCGVAGGGGPMPAAEKPKAKKERSVKSLDAKRAQGKR